MKSRRQFIRFGLKAAVAGGFVSTGLAGPSSSIAASKWIVPEETPMKQLKDHNPADLDWSKLPVTPIENFRTMGTTRGDVNMKTWRLAVNGKVGSPLEIGYEELLEMPSVTRKVLLICPGVFAYVGEWKGVAVEHLLKTARMTEEAETLELNGLNKAPEGTVKRFTMKQAANARLMLAYEVNGRKLPEKHGYPLRLVAEGQFGYDWIKFIHRLTAV